jgi:REP element-mobilizing transposase RayT
MSSTTHQRRSIRLPGYDYTLAGAYFITICTAGRECLFGDVSDGAMMLSPAGRIVEEQWLRSASLREELALDAFVVMPNHVHGIVMLADQPPRVGARGARPSRQLHLPGGSVGAFVSGFKASATRHVSQLRGGTASVWQRNYYEHVIRDDRSLNRIREYIYDNPRRWMEDEYHPNATLQGARRAPLHPA